MKTINTLLLTLLIAGLTSCQKEVAIKPAQTVTYSVQCNACLVYFEDNVWNRNNHVEGRPDAVSQHVNVYGSWTTTFTVSAIDTASIRIYTGVFGSEQVVNTTIKTNDGKAVSKAITMSVNNPDAYIQLPLK